MTNKFVTKLRHTFFGPDPERFITESERQRNAAMKDSKDNVNKVDDKPIKPNQDLDNLENLTPGTLEFNIAIGLPEPDIETLLAIEEFRSTFSVAELRQCKKLDSNLFHKMVLSANEQLETLDESDLVDILDYLLSKKRQITKSRLNRKVKVANPMPCAKCSNQSQPIVHNLEKGTVRLTHEHLTSLAGGKPNLYISLDNEDKKVLVTDRHGNPEVIDRLEPVEMACSVTDRIREQRAKENKDKPKTKLQEHSDRTEKSRQEMMDKNREEYGDPIRKLFSDPAYKDEEAPPALSVTERIRAMRRGDISTVKAQETNPNEAPPILSVAEKVRAMRAERPKK